MDHLTAIAGIKGAGARDPLPPIVVHKTTQPGFADMVAESPTESIGKSGDALRQERAVNELAKIITGQIVGTIFDEQQSLFDSGDQATKHYHQMMVDAISEQLTHTDAFGLGAVIKAEIGE